MMKKFRHFVMVFALAALTVACKNEPVVQPGTDNVAVTKVTVAPASFVMTVGDEPLSLTATVEPENATNRTVTWSSDHSEFAEVSATGIVTAVAEGLAVITATAADGGHKASCNITVNSAFVPLTGLALANSEERVASNGEPLALAPIYTPSDATNKNLTWESDDEAVATVKNGVVTGVAEGTTTIRAVSVENPDLTAECAVSVYVKVESVYWVTTPLLSAVGSPFRIEHRVRFTPENPTNKTVTFRSSDETLMTIAEPDSQGRIYVTPHKTGTVLITVTTEDGGHEADLTVEIVEPPK